MLIHNLFGYSIVGLSPRKILMVRGDTNQGVRMVCNFSVLSVCSVAKKVICSDINHGVRINFSPSRAVKQKSLTILL